MLWNILDGGGARINDILAYIATQNADVVALCELNGWTRDTIAAHAAKAGYNHSVILEAKSPYRVGLFSKGPIEVKGRHADGFHHGALAVQTLGLEVIVTHWAPFDRDVRMHEARRCVELIQAARGPAVLLGDLNSHSPADQALCEAYANKNNRAWAMDFGPHQVLLVGGLREFGAAQTDRWTTATALKPDEPRRRLDFIYVNDAFTAQLGPHTARVLHDPAVAKLSDHWPVLFTPSSTQ